MAHRHSLDTERLQHLAPEETPHRKDNGTDVDVRQPSADITKELHTSKWTSLATTPSTVSSLSPLTPSPPSSPQILPITMSTTPTRAAMKGPLYMPAPGSTRALTKFKGKNAELREFLEEFDGHAKAQELTDKERVHAVLKYVDRQTKHYWKTLDGYTEKDWNKMKTELFDAYPGSKKGHHYTVKGLMKLAEKNAKN
ncbi:hypothetical protein F5879DRAFT_994024 [Lentinula edodes]|nr:hypothetical protein F5879DRAFT_994024 [Lentinula edodes]